MYPEVMLSLFPELAVQVSNASESRRQSSSRAASRKAKEKLAFLNECQNNGVKAEDVEYQMDIDGDNDNYEDFQLHSNLDEPMPELPPLVIPLLPELPPLDIVSPVAVGAVVSSTLDDLVPVGTMVIPKLPIETTPNTAQVTVIDDADKCFDGVKNDSRNSNDTSQSKKRPRKKSPFANPKPASTVIIDIRPLVEEIRAGRYPSIQEYTGERSDICCLCKNKDGEMYYCEFCENAEHLSCVQSRVTIRDPEPDDEFMCHRCIQTIMSRRARAEKRRLQKLEEAMNNDNGSAVKDAKAAMGGIKREIVWNQSDFDAHVESYKKCPSGGPGGLICCASCTAAYSRLLSETSKEMDSQTVSSIGREVSELILLFKDSQVRLQQTVDVSNANDIRMSLLNKNQVGFDNYLANSDDNGHVSIMGFMDVFNQK
mmetsp:Transcript_14099/g.16397  ORF Transcript_14099/g.16397 Transcript_14099/m.16397 type:complete len:427 (+) Transcript_14099:929-2209(+)